MTPKIVLMFQPAGKSLLLEAQLVRFDYEVQAMHFAEVLTQLGWKSYLAKVHQPWIELKTIIEFTRYMGGYLEGQVAFDDEGESCSEASYTVERLVDWARQITPVGHTSTLTITCHLYGDQFLAPETWIYDNKRKERQLVC